MHIGHEQYVRNSYSRVLAHADPWDESVGLMIAHYPLNGPRAVCTNLVFNEVKDGEFLQPILRLQHPEAQELMDMLWAAGLRPTGGKSTTGQLEATERHLADMRQLVFTSLEIPKP